MLIISHGDSLIQIGKQVDDLDSKEMLDIYAASTDEEQALIRGDLLRLSKALRRTWGNYVGYPHEPARVLEMIRKRREARG